MTGKFLGNSRALFVVVDFENIFLCFCVPPNSRGKMNDSSLNQNVSFVRCLVLVVLVVVFLPSDLVVVVAMFRARGLSCS